MIPFFKVASPDRFRQTARLSGDFATNVSSNLVIISLKGIFLQMPTDAVLNVKKNSNILSVQQRVNDYLKKEKTVTLHAVEGAIIIAMDAALAIQKDQSGVISSTSTSLEELPGKITGEMKQRAKIQITITRL